VSAGLFDAPPQATAQPAPRALGVRLLAEVDDLARAVPAAERESARRTVLAPLRVLNCGEPLTPGATSGLRDPFAAVILDGILLRRTSAGERTTIEVLTPGDIFDARCEDEQWRTPMHIDYVVHREARLALLDDRFRVAARRWPGLHDVVYAQLSRQAERVSRALAIQHLTRVDHRIIAFFSDLADRLGRVTPDGIVIDIALTHELLGQAVGGRRPTVSLALADLAASGALIRPGDGTWLIPHAHAGAA
jgi:CRP/FNR family transcriptional regulator, cyclic AMP receptor protein